MRYALAIMLLMLLAAAISAMTNLPDVKALFSNNSTGIMGTISLPSAASRHVFVYYPSGTGINYSGSTFVWGKNCSNSTQSYSNASGAYAATTCGTNTSKIGDDVYTVNESYAKGISYNLTVNISNVSFGQAASTFGLEIYGGHFINSYLRVNSSISCNTTNAQNTTVPSGSCANLATANGYNYTLNENTTYNQPYAIYVNITNTSLGIASATFNLTLTTMYNGTTPPVTIDLLNNESTWVNFGQVNVNSVANLTIPNLDPAVYSATNGTITNITQIRFNHALNSVNTTNGSTLVIDQVAMNITYRNDSNGGVNVYLWNSTGSAWDLKGALAEERYGWINVTGLDPAVYAAGNLSQILFNHSGNGSYGAPGLKVDYIGFANKTNTSVTTTTSIGVEGSLDNVYWFNYGNFTGATSAATLLLTNMTANFVRLNITSLVIGTHPSNFVNVRYLGVY